MPPLGTPKWKNPLQTILKHQIPFLRGKLWAFCWFGLLFPHLFFVLNYYTESSPAPVNHLWRFLFSRHTEENKSLNTDTLDTILSIDLVILICRKERATRQHFALLSSKYLPSEVQNEHSQCFPRVPLSLEVCRAQSTFPEPRRMFAVTTASLFVHTEHSAPQ